MEGGSWWRRESQLLELSISGVAYLLQGNRLVRRDDFPSREGRKKACLVLVSGCSIRGHEVLWAGRDFNTAEQPTRKHLCAPVIGRQLPTHAVPRSLSVVSRLLAGVDVCAGCSHSDGPSVILSVSEISH